MTTFPPLYCFAANVAGDDATVLCLLDTKGPHNYTVTSQDALKLHRANLFLINGLELDDSFAEKLQRNSGNPGLKLIKVGECIPQAQLRKMDAGAQGHEGHHHGEYDPHVWMGLPEAVRMVECIRDQLKQADPPHADGYDKRAAAYIARLKNLQADGEAKLGEKKDRNLVSFHDSLAYFARAFKLNVVSTIETQEGGQPGAAAMGQLVKACLDNKVHVIAVEPQYPTNTAATTLLREIQKKGVPEAEFVVVDPMETVARDELAPEFYEQRMKTNIEHLADKLR
jgi:ABC-type Zn uptake system ZnuABC Zn-binding protein ZnuA